MKYCFCILFSLIILFSNLQLHAQQSSNAFPNPAQAEITQDGQALKGHIWEYDQVFNIISTGKGHNVFFTEEDTPFIIYHAYAGPIPGASVLNIKPVYMDADGVPK